MYSCTTIKLTVVILSTVLCAFALEKPEDLSDEMYCLGCQVMVKELDFKLGRKPTRGMGETVTRALKRVCDIHNFDKYDVDSKKVLKVCKHIKGDDELEAVLISEYGRKHATGKKTTYLDITQLICGTVIKACHAPGSLSDFNEEDGGIIYDEASENFLIKPGKNVHTAHPVPEQEARENQTEDPESTRETTENLKKAERPEVTKESVEANGEADSHDEL